MRALRLMIFVHHFPQENGYQCRGPTRIIGDISPKLMQQVVSGCQLRLFNSLPWMNWVPSSWISGVDNVIYWVKIWIKKTLFGSWVDWDRYCTRVCGPSDIWENGAENYFCFFDIKRRILCSVFLSMATSGFQLHWSFIYVLMEVFTSKLYRLGFSFYRCIFASVIALDAYACYSKTHQISSDSPI